jgi:hypothetical protein
MDPRDDTATARTVIACIGDSLTADEGDCDVDEPWPALLQAALGMKRFSVLNFARGGAKAGAYTRLEEYNLALQSSANIVLLSEYAAHTICSSPTLFGSCPNHALLLKPSQCLEQMMRAMGTGTRRTLSSICLTLSEASKRWTQLHELSFWCLLLISSKITNLRSSITSCRFLCRA